MKKNPLEVVRIGKILKPRGLLGEVKVQVLTNIIEAFKFVENTEKITLSGGFAFIKFKGIDTIESAETLRGKYIEIPRKKLPLEVDEVLADDLVGFEVWGRAICKNNIKSNNDKNLDINAPLTETLTKLGIVRRIENYGASEVFDCGHFMFPNEDAFIIETNMTQRRIIIRSEMLDEEVIL